VIAAGFCGEVCENMQELLGEEGEGMTKPFHDVLEAQRMVPQEPSSIDPNRHADIPPMGRV
jgi:hypothetical protein